MDTFSYDGSSAALRKVFELQVSDTKIICHRCGEELIVALDFESANRYKVHTGIYCPNKHIRELIDIRPKKQENS